MKYFKNTIYLILNFILFSDSYLLSKAEWTLLVYMEDDNNLGPFVKHNLNDMLMAASSDNLNVLVQCNQYRPNNKDVDNPNKSGNRAIYRYKVYKNVLELDSTVPTSRNYDCVKEVVDFFRWGLANYPADKVGFIFWNHATGVVDPLWGKVNPWLAKNPDFLSDNPRAHIAEMVAYQSALENEYLHEAAIHRGILYNETFRTYMNNQQMSDCLRQINGIRKGKIDLVGMDACLMAMAEVAYQIKGYANVLVASQEVERAEGWSYSFLSSLSKGSMTSFDLAQKIVLAYDAYYKSRANIYTLSAINLRNMDPLKTNIDMMVALIQKCQNYLGNSMKQMVANARNSCLEFNTKSYIDLHSYCSELLKQLKNSSLKRDFEENNIQNFSGHEVEFIPSCTILPDNYYQENLIRSDLVGDGEEKEQFALEIPLTRHAPLPMPKPHSAAISFSKDVESLKSVLTSIISLIESTVIANVYGKELNRARGLSIYYPNPSKYERIDMSYLHTDFAKESLWLEFLKYNMGNIS